MGRTLSSSRQPMARPWLSACPLEKLECSSTSRSACPMGYSCRTFREGWRLKGARVSDEHQRYRGRDRIVQIILSDLNEPGLGCCFETDNYSAIPSSVPASIAG